MNESRAPLAAEDIVGKIARVQALPGVTYGQQVHRAPRLVAINTVISGCADRGHFFVSQDGRYVVLLYGEIHNIADLRATLVEQSGPMEDCAVLLALFLAKGPGFVGELRGVFSLLIFDDKAGELTLFTDHFGSRPLYFYEEDGLLLFGSEKKYVLSLMRHAARLDPVGILQVFAHIHNIGARTFIENLRSLPAFSMLAASDRGVVQRRVGYFGFPEPAAIGFRQGVGNWADLLRASVRRGLAGKDRVVLQLSGGLDSRAIACAIPRDLRPFPALTREADNPLEVLYARAIAERLGFEHHVSPSTAPSAAHIPAIVWRTECSISYVHSRSIENHRILKQLADYLLGGQFGDISSGGHVAGYLLEPAETAAFRRRVFVHYALGRDALRMVFTEAFLDLHLPQLEEEFLASFDQIPETNNVNAFQVWDQIERQANFILRAGLVDRHIIGGVYPFLDVDYFNFVRSMPAKWRADQIMYRAVIHHLGPEIRDIPSANDGSRVRGSAFSNRAERLLRKGLRRMHGRRLSVPRSALPFRDDPASVALLQSFLAGPHCDRRIFDVARVEAMLTSGRRECDGLLRTLVTFAVGLPMFVGTPVKTCPEAALPSLSWH